MLKVAVLVSGGGTNLQAILDAIDAHGRRTRAVLITDSDHVLLSALQPETVGGRLNGHENEEEADEDV